MLYLLLSPFVFRNTTHRFALFFCILFDQHVWRKRCEDLPVQHSKTIQGIRHGNSVSMDKITPTDSACNNVHVSDECQKLSNQLQADTCQMKGDVQSGKITRHKRSYTIVLDSCETKKKRTIEDFIKDDRLVSSDNSCNTPLEDRDDVLEFPVHHVEEVSTIEEAARPAPSKCLEDRCWCHSN